MFQNDTHHRRPEPSIIHSIPYILGWVSLSVVGPIVLAKVIFKSIQVFIYHLMDKEVVFHGKIVFLTGASSGLGKALAHEFYQKGCRLILASRNVEALEELKTDLLKKYSPDELHVPSVVRLDLEDLSSLPAAVAAVEASHGRIDVLINNAGISYRGEIVDTDISVDIKLMVVNYLAQVALTKAVLKGMIVRKQGHIIGISSIQGKFAIPFRSCYGASKHALQSFLDCLRSEVSQHGITVTTVSPGYIKTNLSNNAVTATGETFGVTDKNNASGMSPCVVASRISRCLVTKEADLLVAPLVPRIVQWLRLCAPAIYFYVMKIRFWSLSKPKQQ